MPSITLSGTPESGELFADFESRLLREQHEGVEIAVRLIAVYARVAARRRSWLVETLVQEDRLRQDFCAIVIERRTGELLVKLSSLAHAHPTHGVRRAIFGIADWLRAHHPGLEIVRETLGAPAMTPLASGPVPDEEPHDRDTNPELTE